MIFGVVVLVPGISVQVGEFVWDLRKLFGAAWPVLPVIVLILGFAGAIALTRAFVALAGRRTPPEELREAPRERR